MSTVLYYAPGLAGTLDLPQVQDLGLGHAFDAVPLCREVRGLTPDGRNGLLILDQKRLGDLSPAMNIDAKVQVWEQLPSPNPDQPLYGGYYVGHKPTPDDLVRQQGLAGVSMTMGDDNDWEIPAVRRFDVATEKPETALPSNYRIDAHGTLVKDSPLPRWQWLMEATESAWHAMINEDDVSDQSMLETAGKIFSANHVVTHLELGLLRVFSDVIGPATIVALSIDYWTFLQWSEAKKKTAPPQATDGLSSAAGETDASSTTPPLAQTS